LLPSPLSTSSLQWAYIKQHNLQDATTKSIIRPDEDLAKVSGAAPRACRAAPERSTAAVRVPRRPQVFGTTAPVKHTDLLRLIQPHIIKSTPAASHGQQELQ
jgi:chromatin remodeling complex protein RSC6